MRNAIIALVLAALVVGCSKSAKEIQPTYVPPTQYSNYDCDQIGKEMIRVNGRANSLAGQLDDDAETDSTVTGVGIVLFWPALFFLGGTKEQEAEYALLRGEHIALEQASIQKTSTTYSICW